MLQIYDSLYKYFQLLMSHESIENKLSNNMNLKC